MSSRRPRGQPVCIRWLVAISAATCTLVAGAAADRFFAGPNVFPAQILRDRGFLAQDYQFVTAEGYILHLTQALNPLINRGKSSRADRIPILCIHGILESFSVFVTNAFGSEPKDFGNVSLASMSLDEALELHKDEPSAKSLPLLALNHGHEVWLVSRRGFPGSRTMIHSPESGQLGAATRTKGRVRAFLGGLAELADKNHYNFSFNQKFWNYSFDEQAAGDLPQLVDFVLEKTGRKQLSLLGHSAGAGLALMALSEMPALSAKVNHAILWSIALMTGHGDVFGQLAPAKSLLNRFIGAVPPTFVTEPLLGAADLVCSVPLFRRKLCEGLSDLILGNSRGQAPVKPEFFNNMLYSSSAKEVDQLLQCAANRGPMRKFDYGPEGNLRAYGQREAPIYDLGKITLKQISFWVGATDSLTSVGDVRACQQLLRVPFRNHLIRAPFNHQGYFFHKDTARLSIIPTLREIHDFSESGAT